MNERLHRINPVTRSRAQELRDSMTPMERLLWARLRHRRMEGIRFRRQHPVGPYIADFYCASTQLVIEIDGDSHARQEENDQRRTQWLNKNGYRVIRFTNDDVVNNIDGVMEVIRTECLQATSPF
jgi:very-short-patch-repair endonuclease